MTRSSRRASKRRTQARNSDAVPEGGNIDRTIPPTPQIVMAVAVLVLVTVVSFVAVFVVGDLFVVEPPDLLDDRADLRAAVRGAGALVGGSAVVRSTPNRTVRCTRPWAERLRWSSSGLPWPISASRRRKSRCMRWTFTASRSARRSAAKSKGVRRRGQRDITFSRDPNNVSLKIPPRVGTHQLLIAVYRSTGKDLSRTFARCELSFEIIAGERNGPTPMDLLSVESAPQSHLYFSQHYIEQAVTAALQRNELVADEFLRGRTRGDEVRQDAPRRTVHAPDQQRRKQGLSFARLRPLPRYSVLARDRSNLDPQDTQPDLPPHARPVPGRAKVSSAASPPEAPRQSTSASTQVAEASGPVPKTTSSSAESNAEQRSPAPPAPASIAAPTPTAPSAARLRAEDHRSNGQRIAQRSGGCLCARGRPRPHPTVPIVGQGRRLRHPGPA